jgi:hypothetical protein
VIPRTQGCVVAAAVAAAVPAVSAAAVDLGAVSPGIAGRHSCHR